MIVRSVVVVALVLLVSAAAGWFAGFRFAVDGSGIRPRFLSRPSYGALEADRARQRHESEVVEGEPRVSVSAPVEAREPDTPPAIAEATALPDPNLPEPAPVTLAPATRSAGHWPDFRGPNRDGRYDETSIRTAWPPGGLAQLWKQPIGIGYASFVVADGRAFTIEQRRRDEVVTAYDLETGRELWTHGWEGEFRESMGGDGPRATPTYHDGHVYALGAQGELRCLDATTGELLWRRNILEENGAWNLSWGMAASPLIVDEKIIVLPGGPNGRSVVAYHRITGEPIWSALDDQQAYTSPMLVTLAGLRQILVVSAGRAMGLSVEDGELLWDYPWGTHQGISVAQPLILPEDRMFLSAGYGRGAAVIHVTRAPDGFHAETVWANTRMKNKFTSSVLYDGHIYGLDEAILACIDASTGVQMWKGGRYGYGQLLLAGSHLVVLTETGEVALVKATPERHQEVARFPAIAGKMCNHPVIAAGRLLVRNGREMAAFDIRR